MATKKISRKDISKMSFREFLRASREPYRRLFSYMRPYMGRFWAGIVFGALFGVVQAVLIIDVKFVCTMLLTDGEKTTEFPALVVKHFPQVTEMHIADATFPMVLAICMTIPALMLVRGLCSYLNSYCMLWVSVRLLDDIRTQVFRHTLGQSMEFFNKAKAGDLVQTVFNQTRMAQQAITTISGDIVKQPISILSALAVLFYLDWQFTLASLVIFPLCLLPVVLVSKRVRKAGAREEEEAGALMVVMSEAFAGVRVVKTHAREDFESARFNAANARMMQFIMRWRKAMEMAGPMVETVASFGVALALVWAWKRGLDAASFIALAGGMMMLYPPFKALSRIHLTMQKALAATTKVFELLDRKSAIVDMPNARKLPRVLGEVRFENVSFSYGTERSAVRDIRLEISAGSTCALVGASGAGKTTLLALLQRLYEVTSGAILIDGHDIREVTQASLRENIATVNQDIFLFHDTIANNIRYGRLEATPEEVEAVARQAQAHDFILQQPNGYDTIIGDKGCLLSGGQQQRLSIARALLKDAPIILLDEATGALDTETEKQFQAALDTLAEGRTVIAIAHRLSTILHAQQIVVMENGRVVAIGPHAEIYRTSEYYRRLYDIQFNQLGGEEVPLAKLVAVD